MPVTLDGSNFGSVIAASLALSLTTTASSGIIVASCIGDDGGGGVGVPTATGLTFTLRQRFATTGSNFLVTFYAPYSSPFSGTITIPTFSGAVHLITATVFGISGTAGTFDPNASIPASGTSLGSPLTATTSTSGDFIFVTGQNNGVGWSGTNNGWTTLNTGSGEFVTMYQIGAAGTYTAALNPGDNLNNGTLIDALTPGASAVLFPPTFTQSPIPQVRNQVFGY
jgi:hypothetical protein